MHNAQEYTVPYGFAFGTGIRPEPGAGAGLPEPGEMTLGYGTIGPSPLDCAVPPAGHGGTEHPAGPVDAGPVAGEHRNRHRRTRRPSPSAGRPGQSGLDGVGRGLAAAVATVAAAVSLLSAMAAHGPLRELAESGDATGLVNWWPALIYGPWLVASLSIVRAALHHRRAPHAWGIVLLFSVLAAVFCVAEAPRTPIGAAMAGLPVAAALSCFHQLVRQITLTRPPRRPVSPRPPSAPR
ncbi:hypothetical protein [Streptomyces sp. YIM 98790]|uniref:hypothetical protein n=1 Tax=Streptomyces sp. YIM 98790 TaxID=2689077 RepID=UPI00140E2F5D|nr:hypothetical protein [Streptomyces sp. YIM 98790]